MRLNKSIKKLIFSLVSIGLTLNLSIDVLLIIMLHLSYLDGLEKYRDDKQVIEIIDSYNESVEDYAEYIKSLNLDDIEIIVKVMSDMWDNIEGYSLNIDSFYNSFAYNRLAIYMLGKGNCKHMADDFTARMNAINPEYKAYNITVNLEHLDRNLINSIPRVSIDPDNKEEDNDSLIKALIQKKIGNHMVSCITIPNSDIKLIVDPTNACIGILINGKIVLLGDDKVEAMELCSVSNIGIKLDNFDRVYTYLKDLLDSFFKRHDFDSLSSLYGVREQNEVIEMLKENYSSVRYGLAPDYLEDIAVCETSNSSQEHCNFSMTIKPIK